MSSGPGHGFWAQTGDRGSPSLRLTVDPGKVFQGIPPLGTGLVRCLEPCLMHSDCRLRISCGHCCYYRCFSGHPSARRWGSGDGAAGSAQQSGAVAVGPAGELLTRLHPKATAGEPWSKCPPLANSAEGLEAVNANQSLWMGSPGPERRRNLPSHHKESGRTGPRTQGS